MKDLAPNITRQRLLIEGFYTISVGKKIIESYFKEICRHLNLRGYGKPVIFSPRGEGKEINQGYDAFVPLADSGISAYIWSNAKFLSIVIYTCKSFDEKKALEITKKFFKIKKAEHQSF